jgi:hypothetical protein
MEKMTYTKKWLFSIVSLMVLTAFALVLFSSRAGAQPSSVVFQATGATTNGVAYLVAGTATSTYQFDSGNFSSSKVLSMQTIDNASMFIEYVASSTSSILAWQFQYSNDGVNWYGENSSQTPILNSTLSETIEASTTITHLWTPGVAATSTKAVVIPIIAAQHERVVFFAPTGAANGAIYAEISLKRNPSTP